MGRFRDFFWQQELRQLAKSLNRPTEMWVTLYSHELLADHRFFRGSDPPIAEFVKDFDVLTQWTWWSDELKMLERTVEALEAIAPKPARIALGM